MNPSPPRTVDVWVAQLSDFNDKCTQRTMALEPSDQARADHFRFEEDRQRFVLGRMLLAKRLEAYCGQPKPLHLIIAESGKPRLGDYPKIHFSLTHTGNLVGLAWSEGPSVGLDIEQVRPTYEKILGHVFNKKDLAEFGSLPPDEKAPAFFQAWSGKEACLKATGQGLSGGLRDVQVPMTRQTQPTKLNTDEEQTWQLQTLDLPEGYAGNVVWNDAFWNLQVQRIDVL